MTQYSPEATEKVVHFLDHFRASVAKSAAHVEPGSADHAFGMNFLSGMRKIDETIKTKGLDSAIDVLGDPAEAGKIGIPPKTAAILHAQLPELATGRANGLETGKLLGQSMLADIDDHRASFSKAVAAASRAEAADRGNTHGAGAPPPVGPAAGAAAGASGGGRGPSSMWKRLGVGGGVAAVVAAVAFTMMSGQKDNHPLGEGKLYPGIDPAKKLTPEAQFMEAMELKFAQQFNDRKWFDTNMKVLGLTAVEGNQLRVAMGKLADDPDENYKKKSKLAEDLKKNGFARLVIEPGKVGNHKVAVQYQKDGAIIEVDGKQLIFEATPLAQAYLAKDPQAEISKLFKQAEQAKTKTGPKPTP